MDFAKLHAKKALFAVTGIVFPLYLTHRMVPQEGNFRRYIKELGFYDKTVEALAEASDITVVPGMLSCSACMRGPAEGKTAPAGAPAPTWEHRYVGVWTSIFVKQ